MATKRPVLPDPVLDCAEDVEDEYDYRSTGEAIRHVFKEAGYDV